VTTWLARLRRWAFNPDGRNLRARALAAVIGLMGLINIASALVPGDHPRLQALRQIFPEPVTQGSRSLAVVIGFLLLAVAWNLSQRKREAWLLAAWMLVLSVFAHLVKGLDYEEASFAAALLALLFTFRADFDVRSDPRSIRNVLYAAPFVVGCYLLFGLAGFYVLRHHLTPAGWDPGLAFAEMGRRLTLSPPYLFTPHSMQARWFLDSLNLLGVLALVYVVATILRPVLEVEAQPPAVREAARDVVAAHGVSGIAYWAQTPEKRWFFNSDYTGCVAYTLVGDVALAAGDPLGPAGALPALVMAFRRYCERQDWAPAFYQTRAELLPLYLAGGFQAQKVGEEAVLDIPGFSTAGKARTDLRTALNRGEREGWSFQFFRAPIDQPALLAQLDRISADWLAQKGAGGELGFVSGGTPLAGDRDCRTSVTFDAAGRTLGVCTWAPLYTARGWALDVMRRAAEAPNGVMEYMLCQAALHMQVSGERRLSLGLAPLHGVARSEGANLLARGLELVYERAGKFYRFDSLYKFKKKFDPRWEDRHLIYPSALALPKVLLAVVRAQAPYLSAAEVLAALRRP
jgi:phosphatidylglycerol lysyltransferase